MGKLHKCGYSHCIHPNEPVSDESGVKIGTKYYHWDCAQRKDDIKEIRDIYLNRIDGSAKIAVITKVINDLIYKYDQPVGYVKYAVNHFADEKQKLKSPFILLYIRKNPLLKAKYNRDTNKK